MHNYFLEPNSFLPLMHEERRCNSFFICNSIKRQFQAGKAERTGRKREGFTSPAYRTLPTLFANRQAYRLTGLKNRDLVERFPLSTFKILENERPEFIQSGKKRFAAREER